MSHNETRPIAPDVSEGCYVCGAGKDAVLASKTIQGRSVSLCHLHEDAKTVPTKPFSVYGAV